MSPDGHTGARLPRSRKDRPCDQCRRLKQSCRISNKGQPCESCDRVGKACTFDRPPLKRHPSSTPPPLRLAPPSAPKLPLPPSPPTIQQPFPPEPPLNAAPHLLQTPAVPVYHLVSNGSSSNGPSGSGSSSRTEPATSRNLLDILQNLNAADAETEHQLDVFYPSLDMEYTDQEESHYLGPGAFSLLTLDNPTGKPGICRSPSNGNANSTTPDESLVYRQVADPRHPVFFLRNPSRVYENAPAESLERQLYEETLQLLVSESPDLPTRLFQIFLDECLPAMPMINRFRLEGACHSWQGAGPFPYAIMTAIFGFTAVSIPSLRHRCKELWTAVLRLVDHEYRQPRLQTLQIALLDIGGRPVSIPGGNHTAICRAIGVAQLLGLHKDCSSWKLPPWERAIRKRIWWVLYVHDKWNAFIYGRPSNIGTSHVPLPTLRDDDRYGDNTKEPTIGVFIAMCRISVILDKCLPMASDGEADHEMTLKCAKELSAALDGLPLDLLSGKQPGYRSFQIHWHGLAILIARLGFDARPNLATQPHHQAARGLIAIAEDFASYLESLDAADFVTYWSTTASYQLSHAIVVLLRCAVRIHATSQTHPNTQPQNTAPSPLITDLIALVERMLRTIRHAVDNAWEVAEAAWPRIKIVVRSLPPFLPGCDALRGVIERNKVISAGGETIITPETEEFYGLDGNGWLATEVETWLREFPGLL